MSKLSAFDLDETLIMANSSFLFCVYLYRKGVFPFSYVIYSTLCGLLHRMALISTTKLHELIFNRLLLGRSLSSLQEHVEAFIIELFANYSYPPALSALRQAQHLGHFTVLLSNSPSFLVAEASRYLNFNAWKATEYAVDKHKKMCHIAVIMHGSLKAENMLNMANALEISKENISAYSDSCIDLPFLLAAGRAIAVRPDRKLKILAKKHNWTIL
jgi:phosphoserine phosphatase